MPGTTPINSLPYPLLTDTPASIVTAVSNYATNSDSLLVPRFATAAARDAAITSPVDGQLAAVSGTEETYARLGGVWKGEHPRVTRKTSESQVLQSSTTLTNDDTFAFAVEANSTYVSRLYIAYNSSTVANFKMDFTGPASFSGSSSILGLATGFAFLTQASTPLTTSLVFSGSASTFPFADIYSIITIAGTSGTIRVRWAQNTSEATNTFVKIGSYWDILKVA